MDYISRKEVLKILNIHYQTLNNMVKRNEIKFMKIGSKKFYNVKEFLKNKGVELEKKQISICYCRVSSQKQKNDLKRQVEEMVKIYPNYEMITDIGSGLNFNRKGLQKTIKMAINGEIKELIIAYKDRLAKIGYELIEMIIKQYSNGEIIIINKKEEETPEEEITKDIITIMNVYVAKINGLRKYKKRMVETIKNGKSG